MPLRRLPSLNALRAFEATVRCGSMKLAAQELSVTPGAISQQIRALEQDLGVALFRREARKVIPTKAAESLQPDITTAFLQMRQSLDRVTHKVDRELKLNTSAAMITKFLLPRLPRFAALHPDIPISIETEIALNPMEHDGPDLSIRVTRTPPKDVLARLLFEECLLPVASPDLIAAKGLRKPEDLLSVTLLPGGGLPMFESAPGWAQWFDAAGIPHPEIHSAMRFERNAADYPVDMAIAGSGVMLCRASLCHTALQSGQLICPFGPVLRTDVGVYLLARHDRKSEPHVRAFIDWMQAEAGLLRTLPSLHGGH